MTARPSARRRLYSILLVLLLGNLLGLAAGEAVVRTLGNTDADGNFWLGGAIRGPMHPQLTRLTSLVEEFEARPDDLLYAYDAELGWSWRPGATSENGLYHIDERGIRAGARAAAEIDDPIVALYGGSVTFCSEVSDEQSWGHQLEQRLAETGRSHRVLNLGVGGYDMGQVYLRWRSTHPELRPKVVVFGLYPGNVSDNVNVIRAFHFPETRLPFSKPRFVLEGDELGIVNVPCLPPRGVLEVLRNPRAWELLPLEAFHVESAYERRLWHRSRLLLLLLYNDGRRGWEAPRRVDSREGSRVFRLAVRIVQRFHDEVQAAGSRFVVVHLPSQAELARARDGEPMRHAALLSELARRGMTLVDPTAELLELAEREGLAELFEAKMHFAPSSNRVIAEVLAGIF